MGADHFVGLCFPWGKITPTSQKVGELGCRQETQEILRTGIWVAKLPESNLEVLSRNLPAEASWGDGRGTGLPNKSRKVAQGIQEFNLSSSFLTSLYLSMIWPEPYTQTLCKKIIDICICSCLLLYA